MGTTVAEVPDECKDEPKKSPWLGDDRYEEGFVECEDCQEDQGDSRST